MSDRRKVHLSQIDPLRGLAILSVILFHCLGAAFGADSLPWNGSWRSTEGASRAFVLLYPVTFGNAGVSLFFVISGFLIHYSTISRGPLQLGDYARKRFWRIYPPYLVALLLFVGFQAAAILDGVTSLKSIFAHLLLIHNWRDAWVFGINPSFWSLATECQLYVLYLPLWAIRNRLGSRAMLATTFFVSIGIRIAAELRYVNEPPLWVSMSALTLWFDWTLGAYLCDAYLEGRRIFARPRLFIVAMVALIFAASLYRPAARHIFLMTSILFTAMLEVAIWSPDRISRLGQLLARLGLCSYSVYLFHQPFLAPVSRWLQTQFGIGPLPRFVILSAVALAASWTIGPLLYRWIEEPSAKRGRRRREPSPEPQSPPLALEPALVAAQEKRLAGPQ
ncbi:MAG TPA: acyltransferase [Caulifigura sp.]|nr:acyltransferase [Caulifigura sp.]